MVLATSTCAPAVDLHRKEGRLATVTATQPPGRFGAIKYFGQSSDWVPGKADGRGGWINGGFFVLSPQVGRYIKDDATVWEQEPMEKLAAEEELSVYFHHGFWQPMDTLRDRRLFGRSMGVWQGTMENLVSWDGNDNASIDYGKHGLCWTSAYKISARELMDDVELIGFDAAFFGHILAGASILPEALLDRQVFGDIRGFPAELLDGVDAVVHLSAVSNDPMGNKFEAVTEEINRDASVRIAPIGGGARGDEFCVRLELQHIRRC